MIGQRWLVEKQLAQGGLRLAGVLNYIFAGQRRFSSRSFD